MLSYQNPILSDNSSSVAYDVWEACDCYWRHIRKLLQVWSGVYLLRVWSFNRITDHREGHIDFFSFFIRWPSEGIASGDRLENRLLFAEVGSLVIFMLIFKTIPFSILKLMAEVSVPRI